MSKASKILSILEGKKVKVETDGGKVIEIDIERAAEDVVQVMIDDGITRLKPKEGWEYIDSDNKFYRLSTDKPNVIGRAELNQMIWDTISKKRLFKKLAK